MSKLSVVIIAKNEEALIADCIDSVSFADEIIVVDNKSSDKTADIANMKKAQVVSEDTDDFSHLRNVGLKKATGEWLLYVDADEKIDTDLKEEILKVIKDNNGDYAAYRLTRKNYYLGKNEWPHTEKLERLFKKNNLEKWYGKLHESPVIQGKIGQLKGFLLHFTHRNLEYMLAKTNRWSEVEARLRYDAHHPQMSWWRFLRVMTTAFVQWYIVGGGWKLGTVGLIESTYQSFSMFVTYAKLWEMQEKLKTKNEK